jgi:predicted nucleotidyltransferase component of viral defense system
MKDIVQKRLEKFNSKTPEAELNALKEITQEIALYSLYKAGFFQKTCFLGGTNLRILHGLDRFSEDLDFSTSKQELKFDLIPYLKEAMVHMQAYGYDLSIGGREKADSAVQSRFLKDDSIKKILTFKHAQDTRTKIKIKVEVDTNPPAGAKTNIEYVSFPMDFPVMSYDLPSLMAGKLHALLCRPFDKGRDWFDLLWYIGNDVKPNLKLLENALYQLGPWKGQDLVINGEFVKAELNSRIKKVDWQSVAHEVRKFLSEERAESLSLWSIDFFLQKIAKMNCG